MIRAFVTILLIVGYLSHANGDSLTTFVTRNSSLYGFWHSCNFSFQNGGDTTNVIRVLEFADTSFREFRFLKTATSQSYFFAISEIGEWFATKDSIYITHKVSQELWDKTRQDTSLAQIPEKYKTEFVHKDFSFSYKVIKDTLSIDEKDGTKKFRKIDSLDNYNLSIILRRPVNFLMKENR